MPPRIMVRPVQLRRCLVSTHSSIVQPRFYATKDDGPNMNQLPHVSEEKVATNRAMGRDTDGLSPEDLGTPVAEVIKDDPEAKASLPKVMRDEIDAGKEPARPQTDPTKVTPNDGQKRRYTTLTKFAEQRRRYTTTARRGMAMATGSYPSQMDPAELNAMKSDGLKKQMAELGRSYSGESSPIEDLTQDVQSFRLEGEHELPEGLKFVLPEEQLTKKDNMKHRYDEVVNQVTNLVMRHGKKAQAQTFVAEALAYLRLSPPPQPKHKNSPLAKFPIPASALPLNPTLYLSLALDSLGPVIRMKQIKGAAGGGLSLPVPTPLGARQRRRVAVMWILENVEKRKYSAVGGFGRRLGEEIVSVVEGRSSAWEKRNNAHRMAVAARANIVTSKKTTRR